MAIPRPRTPRWAMLSPSCVSNFESESVTAYEVGVKSDFVDGECELTLPFFYQYDDLRFQATDPDVFRGGVANIPNQR